MVQSPYTVAVGATLRTTLQGPPTPPSPPSPPPAPPQATIGLSVCKPTNVSTVENTTSQLWKFDGHSIQSVQDPSSCLALVKAPPYPAILWSCQQPLPARTAPVHRAKGFGGGLVGNDQLWQLTATGQLLMEGFRPKSSTSKSVWCLGYDPLALGQPVHLMPCDSTNSNQKWSFSGAARGKSGTWQNHGGAGCLTTVASAPGLPEPYPQPPPQLQQLQPQRRSHAAAETRAAPTGVINYTRVYHRLGNGTQATSFAQRLLLHADCWRPALGYMLHTWPEHFRPGSTVDIQRMEGAGAYADFRGGSLASSEISKLRKMNFGMVRTFTVCGSMACCRLVRFGLLLFFSLSLFSFCCFFGLPFLFCASPLRCLVFFCCSLASRRCYVAFVVCGWVGACDADDVCYAVLCCMSTSAFLRAQNWDAVFPYPYHGACFGCSYPRARA